MPPSSLVRSMLFGLYCMQSVVYITTTFPSSTNFVSVIMYADSFVSCIIILLLSAILPVGFTPT